MSKNDYLMAVRSTLKTSKVFLKREVKNACINQYNSKILKMHRANIDIQSILDPYACCAYIFQYINKSDRSVSDHLSAVLKESIKNQDGSRKVMKKIAAAYYNVSEVSAQEAAYNLLQLRMCEASRKTEFIVTGPPEYRKRMLKSKDDLEMLDKKERSNIIKREMMSSTT